MLRPFTFRTLSPPFLSVFRTSSSSVMQWPLGWILKTIWETCSTRWEPHWVIRKSVLIRGRNKVQVMLRSKFLCCQQPVPSKGWLLIHHEIITLFTLFSPCCVSHCEVLSRSRVCSSQLSAVKLSNTDTALALQKNEVSTLPLRSLLNKG